MNDLSNNLAVTFSFQVVVEGVSEDNAFQEASGLEIELDVETVSEGGENTFEHSLPKGCLLYTSPSPRDLSTSRMPSSA